MERPYVEDPAPGDENDPEYMDEVFQSFKYMKWKPEDLRDLKDQKRYADWLKKRSEEK